MFFNGWVVKYSSGILRYGILYSNKKGKVVYIYIYLKECLEIMLN